MTCLGARRRIFQCTGKLARLALGVDAWIATPGDDGHGAADGDDHDRDQYLDQRESVAPQAARRGNARAAT